MTKDGLKLKLGPLEIELDGFGLGKCRYMGERFPIQGVTIESRVGEWMKISLHTGAPSLQENEALPRKEFLGGVEFEIVP